VNLEQAPAFKRGSRKVHFFGVMFLAGIFSVFVKDAHREQDGDRKKKEKKLRGKSFNAFYAFFPLCIKCSGIMIQDLCQRNQAFIFAIFAKIIKNNVIILNG
jgi:hypothetical protein